MAKSGFAKEVLKAGVEKIIRLETEKQALADDIKEAYSELKGAGFDTSVIRKRIVPLMEADRATIQEVDAMESLYRNAVNLPPFPG